MSSICKHFPVIASRLYKLTNCPRNLKSSYMTIDLKVIGAGRARTGTTSLKLALEQLLGGTCFHYIEYKHQPELMPHWQRFIRKLPMDTDPEAMPDVEASQWQEVMPDCTACVDEPAAFYWLPLSRAFPDALILLSIRDTDSWWPSMKALRDHRDEEWSQPESIGPERMRFLEFEKSIYGTDEARVTEAASKAGYEAHNRRILDYAEQHPEFKRRLLIWNVKDGWESICRGLSLPVPDEPFPHANKAGEFHGY